MTDDARCYGENGYLLVPGVFDGAEVEEMREAIARILERAGTAHDRDHAWRGGETNDDDLRELQLKGFHDLPYLDAVFSRTVAHPHMVEVLTALIGPNVQPKMLVKPPEQGAPFPMHQDYPYFPHERHAVPRGGGRRSLLQLPHHPRLGPEPEHANTPERPLPVPRPGGSAAPRRRRRRARGLGNGADGRRRERRILGLEVALQDPAGGRCSQSEGPTRSLEIGARRT
jgi:hypothetical protein